MIVLTLGTFDLFHVGHVRLLERCRLIAGGGRVVVAVNPDEFVEQFKGHRPVIPLDERMEVLRACRHVDEVVVGSGRDSKPVINDVAPDIIVIGSDWKERDYHSQLQVTPEWLDLMGCRIEYLPYTEGTSSSQIRAAL